MDERPVIRDRSPAASRRTSARPRPAALGWRGWSPARLAEFVDRRASEQRGADPHERLRWPDDEALPV